jgi:hypothetical protein
MLNISEIVAVSANFREKLFINQRKQQLKSEKHDSYFTLSLGHVHKSLKTCTSWYGNNSRVESNSSRLLYIYITLHQHMEDWKNKLKRNMTVTRIRSPFSALPMSKLLFYPQQGIGKSSKRYCGVCSRYFIILEIRYSP